MFNTSEPPAHFNAHVHTLYTMAADGSTHFDGAAVQDDAPSASSTAQEPSTASFDAINVAAPGSLAEGIVRQSEVPLTQFPNGMRRTVRMVYDVSHGQHHPFEFLGTEDVRACGVETPHALNMAYAYMASAGALNDLVTVTGPTDAAGASTPVPMDDAFKVAIDEENATRHMHKAGLIGQQNTQSMCGQGLGYPSSGLQQCAANVCRSVQTAVRSVVSGDVDGALALTRPVGSSLPKDCPLETVAAPSAYAACNAVIHAVRTAWEAGAKRVGIVSMQTWYPAGLADFVRSAAADGSAFLTSIHASAKSGVLSRNAPYGPSKDSGDGVLNVQVFTRGGGADAMVYATRTVVLPAMTAYDPDVLLVVCGEQNTLPTYPTDVRCETLQTTWAVAVQELMAACPSIVVLTDALLRPNRCAAALTHVMYALQGRAFQHSLGGASASSSIQGTIVGQSDVHLSTDAYVSNTAASGPYAAIRAAVQSSD